MNNKITFISNNVKGIQNSGKRIKLFEYLKSCVTVNGFIFLQETHSCINDEIKWRDEFNGELFFSHGKANSYGVVIRSCYTELLQNSYGVVIGFYGSKIFILLINIYNANTEFEQLGPLSDLVSILDKVKDSQSKNIVLGGDSNVIFDICLERLGIHV